MGTVIIAVIVFGLVGLDVWFMIHNLVHHKGKLGCSGCCGSGCSECGGKCSECSMDCGNGKRRKESIQG